MTASPDEVDSTGSGPRPRVMAEELEPASLVAGEVDVNCSADAYQRDS